MLRRALGTRQASNPRSDRRQPRHSSRRQNHERRREWRPRRRRPDLGSCRYTRSQPREEMRSTLSWWARLLAAARAFGDHAAVHARAAIEFVESGRVRAAAILLAGGSGATALNNAKDVGIAIRVGRTLLLLRAAIRGR